MSVHRPNQLLKNRNIICLASNWFYDPTSKHHVMKELARRNHVLWVNYHASRRPSVSSADAASAVRKVGQFLKSPRRVAENMTVLTPLVIPLPGHSMATRLNQTFLTRQIKIALEKFPSGPIQVWSFAPDVEFLRGRFDEECFVYYCVDEFSEFSGYDGQAIRAAEKRLCAAADLVITTSRTLFEAKRHLNDQTIHVPHGVDFDHFAQATSRALRVPDDIASLSRPILGFWGLIPDWVDLDLIAAVALARPSWSVVLIGEPATSLSSIRNLSNVHVLGRRPYAELPSYAKAFTCGIIPFRRSRLTRAVNPIKLREYLSAGLPVLSTSLPEVIRFAPWARISDTPPGWIDAVEEIMRTPHDTVRCQAAMQSEGWAARVAQIEAHVSAAVQRRGFHRTHNLKAASPQSIGPLNPRPLVPFI